MDTLQGHARIKVPNIKFDMTFIEDESGDLPIVIQYNCSLN